MELIILNNHRRGVPRVDGVDYKSMFPESCYNINDIPDNNILFDHLNGLLPRMTSRLIIFI